MRALCPGSFDPITNGHLDIIERAARVFDEVYVTIFVNPDKTPAFPLAERRRMIEEATAHIANVRVDEFRGLLIDYARKQGIQVVIKGLRAVSDFEYEFQMAQMNKRLYPQLETFFMMTAPEHAFLSSSIIRDVARHGGPLDGLVPPGVARALKAKLGGAR